MSDKSKNYDVYVSKSKIRETFTKLRDYGFTVKVFQSDKAKRAQEADMTDLLIITPDKHIVFAEIKTDLDRLSPGQKHFREVIENVEIESKDVHYLLLEPQNYIYYRDLLLQKNLKREFLVNAPKKDDKSNDKQNNSESNNKEQPKDTNTGNNNAGDKPKVKEKSRRGRKPKNKKIK